MSNERDLESYSKDGRIFQIEYAMKASNLGTTTLAITSKNSTILISEKKIISKLQNASTLRKHYKIYDNIAMSYSGIGSDAKSIIQKAREFCLNHERIYNEHPSLEGLLKYLCTLALKFGEKDMSRKIFARPFGVNIVFAGYEDNMPVLYSFDPSGSYRRFKAKGIGGAAEAVEQELKEAYKSNLNEGAAINMGLKLIKRVMKDNICRENVEICTVSESGVDFFPIDKVQQHIEQL
ncbi:hypothetical protein EDEG_01916 [Edhazardia aedis USNM 41457]|uniref:Proteasome alpha-type subunits domain-containing protein n=1 Tax=Edhazardia aedis (strain USNM 41457) TaxID=1003232 RepID=J9DR24_EDHAE|nr:hypothetical protein EDEG_01916 [Edhazardia aedis USNM 41457]|eukprot:EJW03787.1 hypothetical protein EDEG_01916 [Edhazardia aedis USNM 41457]